MNIVKYYPRIVKALYETPWLILPSSHEILRKGFEAHLAGNNVEIPMPMDDEEDEDEMPMDDMMVQQSDVAVITIEGVLGKRLGMLEQCMGGCDIERISDQIDEVMENPAITKVVLDMSTPGGAVVGIPELFDKIMKCKPKKTFIAYTDTMCASGGMYIAAACDAFYCSPSADVGSIGVYSIYLDESVALSNAGIKVNAISAGKYKLTGASFKPMTDEEKAMLQADVDQIYADFKAAVNTNRKVADEDMQGQVFNGVAAVEKGLADGNINSLQELLAALTEKNKDKDKE